MTNKSAMQQQRMKPILFSTPMVQAILEGSKTQTRRKIGFGKGKIIEQDRNSLTFGDESGGYQWIKKVNKKYSVGDVLWVRETFTVLDWWDDSKVVQILYEDGKTRVCQLTNEEWNKFDKWKDKSGRKPSLFLFKSCCRIHLKITSVRVERLQDISEADCCKEGCGSPILRDYKKPKFAALWQSINGNQSWNNNPFVWVIEFERIEKPDNFLTSLPKQVHNF